MVVYVIVCVRIHSQREFTSKCVSLLSSLLMYVYRLNQAIPTARQFITMAISNYVLIIS